MKYDFDTVHNRKRSDAYKWAVGEGELPMWVADMDFKTAPEILSAMEERLNHGIFGYGDVPPEWYNAYIKWWGERHDLDIKKSELTFSTGVIPSLSSLVRKLTEPGEKVVIQTPVYNIFYNSINNNGRVVVENELLYKDGYYGVSFPDLEEKLSDPDTSLLIISNPHNPVGKIWDRDTLAEIGRLAWKYGVTVISDEIHCDIVEPGKAYTPFAAASDINRSISVSLFSPTKAFNLAGLQTSAVYVYDDALRRKVRRALNTDEVAEPNSFAVVSAVAAFNYGGEWLKQLNEYISENKRTFEMVVMDGGVSGIRFVPQDATYLMWLDIRSFLDKRKIPWKQEDLSGVLLNEFFRHQNTKSAGIAEKIREITGLYVLDGAGYGRAGSGFLRINAACPKSIIIDGAKRLRSGLKELSLK